MPAATATLDDRQFRATIGELSRISGRTYVDTFKIAGAGPIIKILAKDPRAKPPSMATINAAVRRAAFYSFSGSAGQIVTSKDGRTWFRSAYSAKKRLVFAAGPSRGWRLGDLEWADYQATVKERQRYIAAETKRRAARRGLLRMSFIQIADRLGIDLAAVSGGKLAEKIPRRAQMPGRLGQGHTTASGSNFNMVFANFSGGVRGRAAGYWRGRLQGAINRRTNAIGTDMKKGVLADVRQRAKRYPGLFIQG